MAAVVKLRLCGANSSTMFGARTAVDWVARKGTSFTGDHSSFRLYWSVPWMVE